MKEQVTFEKKPDHYVGLYPAVTVHHKFLSPKEQSEIREAIEKILKQYEEKCQVK